MFCVFFCFLLQGKLIYEQISPCNWRRARCLAADAVEGAALALEGVDHVHGGDGLAAGVLSVGHGLADHVLEEHLEHRARLLVDEAGDALHTATASETADGRLGDALDVVAQHHAVALGAALAEALATLAASGHVALEIFFLNTDILVAKYRARGHEP